MTRAFSIGIAAYCMAAATTAQAAQYRLTATGIVSRFDSRYAGTEVPTPPTLIGLGDVFTATVLFDTSNATLTSLFDPDPTVNIYYLSDTTVNVSIGNYRSTFSPTTYSGDSSLQLWNDHVVTNTPVDNQSFSFYDYPSEGPYPFDLPGPRKQESLSVNLFDFTATARTNDLISQIAPVSAFGSRLLSYSFNSYDTNGDDQRFNLVTMSNVVISLESAVPEPASWALMISGIALVGGTARRRHTKLKFGTLQV